MGTIEGLNSHSLPFIEPVGLLFESVLSPRCKRLLVRYWWGVDLAGLQVGRRVDMEGSPRDVELC